MAQSTKDFDVFISHASEDKYIARLLRGYFRAHNIHSWLDQDQFTASMAMDAATLRDRIIPAIANSRYFVILLSEHSITKDWPREECLAARAMRDGGEDIALVAITLDATGAAAQPDWADGLRRIHLRREDGEHDPLERLRNEIGADKATYIGKVKPNFLKQIPMKEVDDHLVISLDETLRMHFVDGGSSLQQVVFPAVEQAFASGRIERLHCELLLMDSKELQSSTLFSGDGVFQKRLDKLINESEIRARTGAQCDLVREAEALLAKYAARFDKLSYEIRLTEQIASGRYIFTGDVGYFAPFVGAPHNNSPAFIFHRLSPFYETALANFQRVYGEARMLARASS